MENVEKGSRNPSVEDAIIKGKLRIEKSKGLKKGLLLSGITGVVLLIIAGAIAFSLYSKEQDRQLAIIDSQRISYTNQLTERDSLINDWLTTFEQIENDLNLIKQKEKIISLQSNGQEFTQNRKKQVIEDIRYLNTLLEENKKKIATLSAQLNNSGGAIKGLQVKIANLEKTIAQYETDINELKSTLATKDFEIGDLNRKMTAYESTIDEKVEIINAQDIKLNQAYLVSGTSRELKDKGIVIKEGGFLGLGKKGSLSGNVSDSLFALIDVRGTRNIEVNSKSAKLVTRHPSDSYTMVKDGENKISYIEINDPDNFWRFSKYAVVEIIK